MDKKSLNVKDILINNGIIILILLMVLFVGVTKENFFNWSSWALFAAAFVALQWGKVNPIIVIIVAGLIGIVIY